MKSKMIQILNKLDKPFFGALLFVLLLSSLLGWLVFQQSHPPLLQFTFMFIMAGLFLALFIFALWKLNRANQWITSWAQHPLWVLLIFIIFPLILTTLWNLPGVSTTLPAELSRSFDRFVLPHFMFFYFWEALIFAIAFFAHPLRSTIHWKFSAFDILRGIILGLGSWSLVMFIHEIIFQWAPISLNNQDTTSFFWPVVPIALILMPISLVYFFFSTPPRNKPLANQICYILLIALIFSMLPLRIISILPAFSLAIIFGIYSRKEPNSLSLIVAYAVFNLLMLIFNWQWVI